jgi:hypothetical protein
VFALFKKRTLMFLAVSATIVYAVYNLTLSPIVDADALIYFDLALYSIMMLILFTEKGN